jgi:putative membrane protein
MHILLRWLIMTVSILISAYLIPGVRVSGFFAALWVALFLGIINTLVKPFLIIITLPINILTLGLFTFVINAVLILLASAVIRGFDVNGFWIAVLYSVVLSIINYLLGHLLGTS